jgi:hypothetical protein
MLWTTRWRLLKKLNIDLPHDPTIPCRGIDLKECGSGYYKGTCTSMFIAELFTIAKLWKQSRCPTTDKWIKKMRFYCTKWDFVQRRMKFCHTQVNGQTRRTSS